LTNIVVVNAVDANWNVAGTAAPNVTISSSDTAASIADDNGGTAGNMTLASGSRCYRVSPSEHRHPHNHRHRYRIGADREYERRSERQLGGGHAANHPNSTFHQRDRQASFSQFSP